MRRNFRIFAGLTALTILGIMIYQKRHQNNRHMLRRIADEGYETAHDVLFPSQSGRASKLRYGPIIPRT